MITIYGIKNCTTIKKTLQWLADNATKYQLHDYKKKGVNKAKLEEIVDKFGWEKVLNRRGMTWRKLADAEKDLIIDKDSAIALMIDKPSIIKRPIAELGSLHLIGFDEDEFKNAFSNKA
jgi:Spx/MgsR family transcriptional regulator